MGLVKFIKSLSDEQIQQMIKRLDELEWSVLHPPPCPPSPSNADSSTHRVDEDSKPSEEDKAHYVAAGLADTTVNGQSDDHWY